MADNDIVIYSAPCGEIQLKISLKGETLWLSQAQMAVLFGIDQSVVARHIRGVYSTGELQQKSTMQKMHSPGSDRLVQFYSLDVVISVGYRANSTKATQFRMWASRVLKQYLTDGYSVNRQLLEEQGKQLEELQKVVRTIVEISSERQLKGQQQELLELLVRYVGQPHGASENISDKPLIMLTQGDVKKAVQFLHSQSEQGNQLFGKEIFGKMQAILTTLNQKFDGREVHAGLTDKAAHLFYFVIRDRPFYDGNKRIASLLFVYLLQKNGALLKKAGEAKLTDNMLVALGLLVGNSKDEDKEAIVGVLKVVCG
jgi:prophage maintenance system killer protein